MLIRGTPWRQRIGEVLSQRQREVITREDLTPSAVLVPIYEKGGENYIVLTKRGDDLEHHKGQISFPGGAYDVEDGDLKTTALREVFEEIGVCAEDVEILGTLDDQATISSKFVITPFVGIIPFPYRFSVNRDEVQELIQAPVATLLDPACFSTHVSDAGGKIQPWVSYHCGDHNIIGITARILKQFLDLVFV